MRMFRNLTKFNYQRSAMQAIGFYIAYLLLILLTSVFWSCVIYVIFLILKHYISIHIEAEEMRMMGANIATIICVGLSIAILQQKRLYKNFHCILIVVLTVILSQALGGIGGMIPVAYFTTRAPLDANNVVVK